MSETNDDLLVEIPAQDGVRAVDEDVEAHGMREVAAGVTVAAALIGSAGAANALSGPPTAGGTAGAAVQAADQALRGTGTATGEVLAKNLAPHGATAVGAAHGVDTTTSTTVATARQAAAGAEGTARGAAATAQEIAQQRANEAGAVVGQVSGEAESIKQQALTAAGDLGAMADEIADAALSDISKLAETASNAVRSIFGWLQDEVTRTAAFLAGEVDRTKGDVEQAKQEVDALAAQKIDEATTTVDQTRAFADGKVDEAKQAASWALSEARAKAAEATRTLDETKASAVITVGTISRALAHDVQEASERGVTTAKGAPATAIDTATATADQVKQTWQETVDRIEVPDASAVVDDAVDKAEEALGGVSTAGATSAALP